MGEPALKLTPATRADLEALPETIKGEIIDGVLYTQPRPRARHQRIIALVDHGLLGPYDLHGGGNGGPGGWWILPEPGIEVPGSPEFSPDLAGWRRERMPELPEDDAIRVVPDWICEIYTPRIRRYTLETKRPFYAKIGVPWLWLVDLDAQTFTISHLHEGKWLEHGLFVGDHRVAAEPFEAVELDVSLWWSGRAG